MSSNDVPSIIISFDLVISNIYSVMLLILLKVELYILKLHVSMYMRLSYLLVKVFESTLNFVNVMIMLYPYRIWTLLSIKETFSAVRYEFKEDFIKNCECLAVVDK